jgi:hypothetical protein
MAEPGRRYTLDEANALLPEVRAVLIQLAVEKARLESAIETLTAHGVDGTTNGDVAHADALARSEAEMTEISGGMRALVEHLESLDVELRDLEQGLVDFPGERAGQPVWLCWRLAEPDVAFWHPLDRGFADREPW